MKIFGRNCILCFGKKKQKKTILMSSDNNGDGISVTKVLMISMILQFITISVFCHLPAWPHAHRVVDYRTKTWTIWDIKQIQHGSLSDLTPLARVVAKRFVSSFLPPLVVHSSGWQLLSEDVALSDITLRLSLSLPHSPCPLTRSGLVPSLC